ncbi:70 kDa peptidyl-prolyl isomerase-like [Salvia miltiorrhiza]|uniref:70 kDa peptidyl-prolyl isomerase-like n=1 Tax=Salvia miltiorrhiza TaxID=226208 RepID=UPI0025ACF41F|nr:70 kDa peptidyl-prolyl isomerase-like [Salvia miltiorrhiza]
MEKEAAISCHKPISILPETNLQLRKQIIQKGISWQTPIPGDEVEVHYHVRLQEGGYLDSSWERGRPFKFRLGQCEVIKGWDEGIGTMRKGERAVFTIPPVLAYGEAGSPPFVPPNSTLVFDVELISWCPIRDVCGDGGVMKKIVREGEGWATPNEADEVFVKYVAKDENGIVVSKCHEGLEFSLTNGHLCPAMSKAVRTMRKGEKAELSVKFSYGLIQSSRNDEMPPPHQNLIIYLELVSWNAVIDVKGDDSTVLKKITKQGEGFDRASEGSLARVVCLKKLEDGTVVDRRGSEDEPLEYVCGEEEEIDEGLDRAVMTMRKGEEAVVKIKSAEASFHYQIKLIDFIKEKPFWKMDAQERIAMCKLKKQEGNTLFKKGKFQLASNKYNKALNYVEYNHSFSHQDKVEGNSLRASCFLNNAACKLKLGEYEYASRLCTKVLELDSCNVKALFRRSQAYIRTCDLDKAEDDINRALSIDPHNRDVKMKYKEVKEKRREYVKHEAKIFSSMISRIS